jgi:hypothetical protein
MNLFTDFIIMFPCIVTQYTKMTNKMQLCRIIYYSLAALPVSSDIVAHHQEHLNCITVSGITHVCRCRLVAGRKLLDDLKERRGYSHLKEEPLDRTMWRALFGRGFGPVVWQTAKWTDGTTNCNVNLLRIFFHALPPFIVIKTANIFPNNFL